VSQRLILDVGCGSRSEHIFLEKKNVVYCDLRITTHNKRFLSVCCDAQLLPFQEKVFQFSHASHLLEHLPEPLSCLKEIKRVTRNKVIIKVPKATSQRDYWDNPEHIYAWNIDSLKNLLGLVFSKVEAYPTRRTVIQFPFLQQTFNRLVFWVIQFLSQEKTNEITAICRL